MDDAGPSVSRRGLLRGLASAVTVASAGSAGLLEADTAASATSAGTAGALPVTILVNGKERRADLEARVTLAEALRDVWGLTGTKVGCDRGACGACTVLLNGVPVNACLTLVHDADGAAVTTIEGLGSAGALSPIQQAFVDADALQCGFCTPGMLMSCEALVRKSPAPSPEELRRALSGNLCRCGTYLGVFAACAKVTGGGREVPRG